MPILLRQGKEAAFAPLWCWEVTPEGREIDIHTLKRSPKQQQALACLRRQPVYRHQTAEYELSDSALQGLKKKNLITLNDVQPESKPWQPGFAVTGERLKLNTEQATAVGAIRAEQHQFSPWLLDGVTGSGKPRCISVCWKMCWLKAARPWYWCRKSA